MPCNGFRKLFSTLVCLTICCCAGMAQARDMESIRKSGNLIVAIPNIDNPPFFLEKEGQLIGLDIDLANAIGKALNLHIVFNRSARNFNEAVALVANNQADISVAKISRTLVRAQTVLFSDPYITMSHALLLNRVHYAEISAGQNVSEILQHYRGTIGVVANSSFVGNARTNFPQAKVVEFADWDHLIEAVSTGKVTAAYRDAFEVKRIFKLRPKLTLTVRSVLIDDIKDTIGIAIGAQNILLQNFLNLFLEQSNFKFTPDQILTKYEKNLQ